MPFTPGRQPGSVNRVTRMAREFALKILSSEKYRETLKSRADRGVLHPSIENMLWQYAYGKPKDVVELNVNDARQNFSELSEVELAERAAKNAQEAARLALADAEAQSALERGKESV